MRVVTIFGAGGHGLDLAGIVEACGDEVLFMDEDARRPGATPLRPPQTDWLVGHGSPKVRVAMAAKMAGHVPPRAPVPPAPLLVHPSAVVEGTDAGRGSVVAAGSVVSQSRLGDHTHVGAGCTLTRTWTGDFCQIGPGCHIAGDVVLGDGCFLGVGVTVRNLVTIGDGAMVGAGAVVVDDVPPGVVVAGVPARVVRSSVPDFVPPAPYEFDNWGEAGEDWRGQEDVA